MPLISVCIPAYNRAGVLPAVLDSLLSQDFDDFDIVIAEDSSPERLASAAKVSE
jgi:glycosyltransferase involved in cell wall biosynthesis